MKLLTVKQNSTYNTAFLSRYQKMDNIKMAYEIKYSFPEAFWKKHSSLFLELDKIAQWGGANGCGVWLSAMWEMGSLILDSVLEEKVLGKLYCHACHESSSSKDEEEKTFRSSIFSWGSWVVFFFFKEKAQRLQRKHVSQCEESKDRVLPSKKDDPVGEVKAEPSSRVPFKNTYWLQIKGMW